MDILKRIIDREPFCLYVKITYLRRASNVHSKKALKDVKRLYEEFGFTAGMLKGALAEG